MIQNQLPNELKRNRYNILSETVCSCFYTNLNILQVTLLAIFTKSTANMLYKYYVNFIYFNLKYEIDGMTKNFHGKLKRA
jgi:hypothetical protein